MPLRFTEQKLQALAETLPEIRHEDAFLQLMHDFIAQAGFNHFIYTAAPSTIGSPAMIDDGPYITSIPKTWIEPYMREKLFRHDRAIKHVMGGERSVFRRGLDSQVASLNDTERSVREYALESGFVKGFVMPLYGVDGAVGLMGLINDKDADCDTYYVDEKLQRLHRYAELFHKRFMARLPPRFYDAYRVLLSERQAELMRLLIYDGLTFSEAAEKLHRSPKTIEKNTTAIYRKLGAKSQAQAAAICGLWRLI